MFRFSSQKKSKNLVATYSKFGGNSGIVISTYVIAH